MVVIKGDQKIHVAEHTAMSRSIAINEPAEYAIKECRDREAENSSLLRTFSVSNETTIAQGNL